MLHNSNIHVAQKCVSTSIQIACCEKSMSTSSKIACCIIQDMHVAKTSMSTWIEITCCKIQDMHVATSRMSTSIDIACCKKKHVNMNSTCMLHNSRHACCANQDEKNHVAFTCARMSRAERVVYWYTFSNPHTNNAPGRLMHTVISFIHLSGLSSFSFSANLLTIFIPSFVFPPHIPHM